MKRNQPLQRKTAIKANHVKGRTGKHKTKRKYLEQATEKIASAFYRGLPCVICQSEGVMNEHTCWHHIIERSISRAGKYRPENLIPLCPIHHTYGKDICAHGYRSVAVGRFWRWLEDHMPLRFAACMEIEKRSKGGSKFTASDVQADYDLWTTIDKEDRNYTFICELVGVEAYGH